MCWVTVDQAVQIADEVFAVNARGQSPREIKDDIIANGWNDEVGSFTTAYDGTDIDASVLAIGLFSMLNTIPAMSQPSTPSSRRCAPATPSIATSTRTACPAKRAAST